MIRIINGKPGPASSLVLRCDCCGHTIKVSTQGKVPTNGCLCDGQSAIPAPALHVEDLGYMPTQESHQAFHADNGGKCPWGCDKPAGEQAEATIARLNPLLAAKAGSIPESTSGPIDFRRAIDGLNSWQKTWIGY